MFSVEYLVSVPLMSRKTRFNQSLILLFCRLLCTTLHGLLGPHLVILPQKIIIMKSGSLTLQPTRLAVLRWEHLPWILVSIHKSPTGIFWSLEQLHLCNWHAIQDLDTKELGDKSNLLACFWLLETQYLWWMISCHWLWHARCVRIAVRTRPWPGVVSFLSWVNMRTASICY